MKTAWGGFDHYAKFSQMASSFTYYTTSWPPAGNPTRSILISFNSFSILCCHTSRSTWSNTRQRPFDSWLCAVSCTTSLFASSLPSQPRFAREWHNKVRPQHRELRALLFPNSAWVLFYVPQNCEQRRVAKRGLQFIVLIRQHWRFDQIVFNG